MCLICSDTVPKLKVFKCKCCFNSEHEGYCANRPLDPRTKEVRVGVKFGGGETAKCLQIPSHI